MSSQQTTATSSTTIATHNAAAIIPGLAQRQQHDHSRPLPPPTSSSSPFATGQTTTTASFRSVSRSPVLLPPPTSSSPRIGPAAIVNAITSTTTTTGTTTTGTGTGTTTGEVSLEAPRPDGDRLANEYVETPFRPNNNTTQQQQQQQQPPPTTNKEQAATNKHHHHVKKQQCATSKHHRRNGPITKQPVSFTKEPSSRSGAGNATAATNGNQATDSSSLSIMCERCGRCRCESCREPPPLPSRWLCDNSCYCSAETVLDYASCLCCAKGLFYHCSLASNDDATTCADEPCSCVGPRRAARWSCLSALALVLPCLLCYWPLKGCVALCEAGYAKHASQGCRCQQPELGGEKRLLAPEQP